MLNLLKFILVIPAMVLLLDIDYVQAGPCTDAGGSNCFTSCPSNMIELGTMGCGPAFGTAGTKCCALKTSENTVSAASIIPNDRGQKNDGSYSLNDFVQLAVNIAAFILSITGALSLLMFVYGGATMMLSAGVAEKVAKGKSIITGAVIGLLIVFASYTIIGFVLEKSGFDTSGKNWATTSWTASWSRGK